MRVFDKLPNGEDVYISTLSNDGFEVDVLSLGATINAIRVPSKKGSSVDVVLGYDTVNEYLNNTTYFGMTIGRFANRIDKAFFNLDGKKYQIDANENGNSLHSGKAGFCWKNWKIEEFEGKDFHSLKLTVTSPDGEDNWPGAVEVICYYTLKDKGQLEIRYEAKTDKRTYLNLTNHSYFNLTGNLSKKILSERLQLDSSSYLEVGDTLIPTGKIIDVDGTPFDFRNIHAINERIDDTENGYDHCFIFERVDESLKKRAEIIDDDSEIKMEVLTTMPAIQIYTANFMENGHKGKGGVEYTKNGAICFETQYYPDSPNHEEFPSCIIEPGRTYEYKTVYKFSSK